MEIRVLDKENLSCLYRHQEPYNIQRFLNRLSEESKMNVEIQLVYTHNLIRAIDYDTFIKANKYVVAFIRTAYYSGQADGSFTVLDSRELETLLPFLFSIKDLDDEDINRQVSSIINENLSVRLISCNHIILPDVYSIVDSILFGHELDLMNRVNPPQNDYTEYMISHIALYNKETRETLRIEDENQLYSLIFSDELLINLDKSLLDVDLYLREYDEEV